MSSSSNISKTKTGIIFNFEFLQAHSTIQKKYHGMNHIQNTPNEYATRSRYPTTTPNITTEEKVTNQDIPTTETKLL
jgi:hypothetical protein